MRLALTSPFATRATLLGLRRITFPRELKVRNDKMLLEARDVPFGMLARLPHLCAHVSNAGDTPTDLPRFAADPKIRPRWAAIALLRDALGLHMSHVHGRHCVDGTPACIFGIPGRHMSPFDDLWTDK